MGVWFGNPKCHLNRSRLEFDNVAVRLKTFIESCGLTNSQFADRCGIPRPSLSQLLTGRNKKISDVIVGQIHQAFPELSVLWLMFGEGKMLNSPSRDDSPLDFSDNLFAENLNINPVTEAPEKYPALGGLKGGRNQGSDRINSESEDNLKIQELERQIEKMRRNPRKVSHITVYYDDSTFETFYPRR